MNRQGLSCLREFLRVEKELSTYLERRMGVHLRRMRLSAIAELQGGRHLRNRE